MNNDLQHTPLPAVSIVVIGLNVEAFLSACLQSVFHSEYPSQLLEVIYVDSGSTDRSLAIASRFSGVRAVVLNDPKPNAAKGRNLGLSLAQHDLIHFVDADSYLDPQWLNTAVGLLSEGVAAVAGRLSERFPDRNLFHRMAHLEWNLRVGDKGWSTQSTAAKTFGGNVLIRRSVLLQTQGYDAALVAGEDPDLSYRVRQLGYKILRSNAQMASHDINLGSVKAFLKRTRRSGLAYSLLAWRYHRHPEKFMLKRLLRIVGGVLTPWFVVFAAWTLGYPGTGIVIALALIFRLVFKAPKFSHLFQISLGRSIQYSLYLGFSIYPQFLGVLDGVKTILFNNIARVRRESPQVVNPDQRALLIERTSS